MSEGLNFTYKNLEKENLQALYDFNNIILPVVLPLTVYKNLLQEETESYTRIAYYEKEIVGAICCRLEDTKRKQARKEEQKEEKDTSCRDKRLYLITFGVRAKYQNMGIGTHLLTYILNLVSQRSDVHDIYLHVQTSNKTAIDFYQKFGFLVTETIRNFYKRIAHPPPHCYILSMQYPFLRATQKPDSITIPSGATASLTISVTGVSEHNKKKRKQTDT